MSPVNVGETVSQRLPGPVDQVLLALSMGFQKQGNGLTITVAEDISAVDAGIYTFQFLYFLFSLFMMILLLISQRWIVRSSLKPLTNARLNLENIARGQTDKLPEDVPIEIRPLVNEINLLLNLLKRRLDRTRTAIGNLAHKLKTPMSLLSHLENDPVVDKYPKYRQQLRQQVDSMSASLERELNKARLAGDGKSGKRFIPGDDIGSLLNTLQQVYFDKHIEVYSDIQSYVNWPADHEDMLELLGTLLDNAYKWANSQIRITVYDHYKIVIEDDGPGCPSEMMQSLSTRGRRLDETVDGYGLGLSIADDIVSFYKGTLDFGQSEKFGGMKVTVTFPSNQTDI